MSVEERAGIDSDLHCTVHPSKGEGFGLMSLQPIACETPVIALPGDGDRRLSGRSNALCLRTSGRVPG